jgi:hypothetical protein
MTARLDDLEGRLVGLEEQLDLARRDRARLTRHMSFMGRAIERLVYGNRLLRTALRDKGATMPEALLEPQDPEFERDVSRALEAIEAAKRSAPTLFAAR